MSTSTLTLYKNCLIVPERNFVVEDIEAYLGTFLPADKIVISDFQYLRRYHEHYRAQTCSVESG